jgi:hypothetical protein
MDKIKNLIEAIKSEKDVDDTFNKAVYQKLAEKLNEKKREIAKSLFGKKTEKE